MSWICPKCETENNDNLKVCEVCDTPRELSSVDKLKEKYNDAVYKSLIRFHHDLLESADQGDASAQYKVGEWIENRAKDDYNKIAVLWFRKAALQGYVEAQLKLANCYKEGRGVTRSKYEALKWYKKASKGNDCAEKEYIKLKYDDVVYKSVLRYRYLLLASAEKGNAASQFQLGEWFEQHKVNSYYKTMATYWYLKAAHQGNKGAMLKMGECYQNGWGVEQNIFDSIMWYKKVALRGSIEASRKLANIYLYGKEGIKNVEESFRWFDKTRSGMRACDMYYVAISYQKGDGVKQDTVKALSYYRGAAEKGSREAQYKLGSFYEKGIFVDKNITQAKYWYNKAVEQGHEEASRRLSFIKTNERDRGGCLFSIVAFIMTIMVLGKALIDFVS